MKLYNIFEGLILESTTKNQVMQAIKGEYSKNGSWFIRRYDITYAGDSNEAQGRRQIEIYALGTYNSKPVIRAYQIWGDTKTDKPSWKLFRLDRIMTMKPTDAKTFAPISDYTSAAPAYVSQDNNGQDKTMDGDRAIAWVEFPEEQIERARSKRPIDEPKDSPMEPNKGPVDKVTVPTKKEPITREPEAEPEVQPTRQSIRRPDEPEAQQREPTDLDPDEEDNEDLT